MHEKNELESERTVKEKKKNETLICCPRVSIGFLLTQLKKKKKENEKIKGEQQEQIDREKDGRFYWEYRSVLIGLCFYDCAARRL